MGINKAILVGNLGQDPEMRYTQSGQPLTTFSVATNRRWTGTDGEPQEETTWHNIVAWGKLAEICNEYLSKGRQVYVEGRLQTRQYEDREGVTRYRTEIVALDMQMLGGRPRGGAGEAAEGAAGAAGAGGELSEGERITPDDIPF